MNTENSISLYFCFKPIFRQPWSKLLGTLEEIWLKDALCQIAKFTHILPLKKLGDVVIRGYFCCPPLPPSNVDCVELKLEYRASTLHREGKGEGRCLNLTSYWVSVSRGLISVVGA